jgi:predicted ATPase/serine phosphatase RsbU (regulator of sigma subunit)
MTTILEYRILETLLTIPGAIICRGETIQTQTPVLLKICQAPYPTQRDLNDYTYEYETTRKLVEDLHITGILKPYRLEYQNNILILVFEDFPGEFIKKTPIASTESLVCFLNLAVKITELLGEIHQCNVIHKDIKPGNILVNPHTGEVKLTGFNIASLLPQENQAIINPTALEGTLSYIAPEQTGRMNRAIDYRADFYALGCLFYQMVTGRLPFQAEDPMELIHAHIARQPIPPDQINCHLPTAVSAIILKLLAKTAEDRYQSAFGLKADLEFCLQQLQRQAPEIQPLNEPFIPGQQDVSNKFKLSKRLYGREHDVAELVAVFDRVSQGAAQVMLVTGYSGIGKSALVYEIHKPIVRQGGYFISGKFDQLQRSIPYFSVIQAFEELIRQLLTEPEERIQTWRKKLLQALGNNGQVIADVIPPLELIIGRQNPVVDLGPTESQNRFNLVFQNFIRVFAQPEHPLVIFLDDLQWIDSASLNLLNLLITAEDSQHILWIGAYRDNEVDQTHPLLLKLNEWRSRDVSIHKIHVQPLQLHHIQHLIADTLSRPQGQVHTFAELVLKKTGGNPFFINQFLKSLYQENLLRFNGEAGQWQWNLAEIQSAGFTDNVVELMAGKIQKLSAKTQNALELAACIGNEFTLSVLSTVYETSLEEMVADLWDAVREELIMPTGDGYKYLEKNLGSRSEMLSISYRFLHDRIQQAAYSLIPVEQRQEVHLKIGRLLLNSSLDKFDTHQFDIVNHLNLGRELITSSQEKHQLAQANLLAGQKAKDAIAYEVALAYLRTGVELLSPHSWKEQYQLSFELYRELSECEYLCGNFETADRLFELTSRNAGSDVEKAAIYSLQIVLYTTLGKFKEVLQLAQEGLRILGLNLPFQDKKQIRVATVLQVAKIKLRLTRVTIPEILHLPTMTDARQLAKINLMAQVIPALYYTNMDLANLFYLKMADLSLASGNTATSSMGYLGMGRFWGEALGDSLSRYEFGKLALDLIEKFNVLQLKCNATFLFGGFINHWKNHARSNIDYLKTAYRAGIESGNFVWACYANNVMTMSMIIVGEALGTVLESVQTSLLFANRSGEQFTPTCLLSSRQFIRCLQGLTTDPLSFSDSTFDEINFIEQLESSGLAGVSVNWYYILKLQVLYLLGDYSQALTVATKAEASLGYTQGLMNNVEYTFYHSLTLAAVYSTVSPAEQQRYLRTLRQHQSTLKRWAKDCPDNFQPKYCLVSAEIARLCQQEQKAAELYEQAIQSARASLYGQTEAIANELAARFYKTRGYEAIAKTYLLEACHCYLTWGAGTKVAALESEFATLLFREYGRERGVLPAQSPSGLAAIQDPRSLDLNTVLKASQAVSGEIILENLLNRLITIVIENAGAEKGCLILNRNGTWVIEAEGTATSNGTTVLQSVPLKDSQALPQSIVNYVERTLSDVVLPHAAEQGLFTADPYVIANQLKSVLCSPILNQGELIGMIYLENNLATNVFTPDRLEVLRILGSQAAISLKNALLYQTVEQKVAERTVQLEAASTEISALNERLKAENLRMGAELNVAHQLQQMILPEEEELQGIPGLQIAGFMTPAEEVGGDYYDVLHHQGRVKIGIGDVTGHGLESGILMLMIQTAIRTLSNNNETNPVKFLNTINRTIFENAKRMKCQKILSLTMLDYEQNCLRISGQHEDILVVRAGGSVERIDTTNLGFPLGLIEDITDLVNQIEIELNPGDGVVLYTDGITEAINEAKQPYGLERFCQTIIQNWQLSPQEIHQAVIADVRQHIGPSKIYDDITVLILKSDEPSV